MSGKVVLSGDLSFNNLAEVFQILGGNKSTGVLRITSQYAPNPGVVYFVKGDPINATDGSLRGLDAVYALFGWTQGTFEFVEEKVPVERAIKKNRMEVVLDAMRMLDDGVIEKVGPASFDEVSLAEQDVFESEGKGALPILKGPQIDFLYVIEEEDFSDSRRIVTEGSHGKWIWVILDGSVKIIKETAKGPLTVAQIGEGCYIGTFASFMFQEYARSASVIAVGDVRLGLLDTQQLSVEFRSLSREFRSILMSMDARLRRITDRVAELAVKKEAMTGLAKGKEVILKKGSTKEGVYIISEGEACIVGQTEKGPLHLLTLAEEDFFGNIPFLDSGQEPQYAAVMASKELKVSKLDTESLRMEYDQLQGTLKSMILNVSSCISFTTRLAYNLYQGK
ncbi:MAG: cyclic nucleotide-binding domain-containing protein [Desulfobacteraceae bacterium]|jgi:CRP-like cAMP-binding protein